MSAPDWLPPDGRTAEEWVTETPVERRKRKELEEWKARRVADHRRMLAFLQGRPAPREAEPAPAAPKPRPGSAWS